MPTTSKRPAMTREERNARKSDLRRQSIYLRLQSRIASIGEIFIRARNEGLTHSEMLKMRESRVFTGNDTLPSYVAEQLRGAWDVCQFMAYRESLVFCYPHPETGAITPASDICNAGLAQSLADKGLDKQGAHYWRMPDGSYRLFSD